MNIGIYERAMYKFIDAFDIFKNDEFHFYVSSFKEI